LNHRFASLRTLAAHRPSLPRHSTCGRGAEQVVRELVKCWLRREAAMSKVIADITMSLDGYVASPSAGSPHGVIDVDELQTWVVDQDRVDTQILEQSTAATGAVVMGRRLFDILDAPDV
jgi:hypothetical protein